MIDSLRSQSVRRLVTCDPHCARMFDLDYRQQKEFQALGIEVLHHTELLARLVSSLSLQAETGAVTLHDPCYLSRGRGVTQEPRSVLRYLGADLVEMPRHAENTFCCGAGGGQLFIADDSREPPGGRVNDKRFEEAESTGASTVAVACPYCPIMLRDAADRAGRADIRVADVAELVAERLPRAAPRTLTSRALAVEKKRVRVNQSPQEILRLGSAPRGAAQVGDGCVHLAWGWKASQRRQVEFLDEFRSVRPARIAFAMRPSGCATASARVGPFTRLIASGRLRSFRRSHSQGDSRSGRPNMFRKPPASTCGSGSCCALKSLGTSGMSGREPVAMVIASSRDSAGRRRGSKCEKLIVSLSFHGWFPWPPDRFAN